MYTERIFSDKDIKKFVRCIPRVVTFCDIEVFKQLIFDGYHSQYLISNYGRVVSTSYRGVNNWVKVLRHKIRPNGYCEITLTLCGNTLRKSILIHRLVACHFIPNPDNKPQINHIDGDKENNYYGNLEWCTEKENIQHAFKNNLHPILYGEQIADSIYTESAVINVCRHLEENKLTLRQISDATGVSYHMVLNIYHHKSWVRVSNNYNIDNYNYGVCQED